MRSHVLRLMYCMLKCFRVIIFSYSECQDLWSSRCLVQSYSWFATLVSYLLCHLFFFFFPSPWDVSLGYLSYAIAISVHYMLTDAIMISFCIWLILFHSSKSLGTVQNIPLVCSWWLGHAMLQMTKEISCWQVWSLYPVSYIVFCQTFITAALSTNAVTILTITCIIKYFHW